MTDTISFNLQVAIKEGQLESFRSLMEEMVASTQEEPGTLNYEWFLSPDEKTCHIYERYQDSPSILIHLSKLGLMFAPRLLACVDPVGLVVYGDPSAEVRALLDSFGPVYFSPFGGFVR